jgi:mRNA-degrading endonuclease RelE of RelBE toxin-antitoxin system
MSYNIETTGLFDRQIKRLSKKFPSLKIEFAKLVKSLKTNPEQGTPIANQCYKIRLAIASKGKGKSGGARIITHLQVSKEKVYLLSIYDKSEQDSISDRDIKILLELIPE